MTNPWHPTFKLIGDAFPNEGFQREYLETAVFDPDAKIYGSFDYAIAKFQEQLTALGQPVDALLGFSQGALFAALVAARALKIAEPKCPPPFRCLVLLCPPNPEFLRKLAPTFFDEPLPTPALVCKGLEDDVVPGGPEMYGSLFTRVQWSEHPSGHQPLPSEKTDAENLSSEIRDFLAKHC